MRFSRILKQFIPLFLTVCWIVVFYIIINHILKLSFSYTLAILAITGFALALGLQDTLKDLVAGFILPFEDHIAPGNKIQIGNIFGEIVRIGLREMELKQPDGKIAIIPTRLLLNETVENVYIEKENCPVHIDFYLPFSSDLDKCREIAHKSAIISPYLFLNKPVTVSFSNELLKDQNIIKMSINAFLLKIEFQPLFISEITESVVKELIHATIISDTG
jgi:small-conductance mechanosensitive channel